jgi:hypothetical protein
METKSKGMLDTLSVARLGELLEEAAERLRLKQGSIYYHANLVGEPDDEMECEMLRDANNLIMNMSDTANSMGRDIAAIMVLAQALQRRK